MTRIVSLLQWQVDSWSFNWVSHWTEQALSNAINMNRTSSIECNRHEQNKLCYTRVVNKNQKWVCYKNRQRLISSLSSSLNSESAWTTFQIEFSHESSFICIFYDLSLFTTLITTARWYVLRTEWNVYYMSQDREWNIYYMSEITKIWAETHWLLNIWSWIERRLLEWQEW